MHVGSWWEIKKESGQYEGLDVGEGILLKWISDK
jgi:hypothetical protein